MKKSVLLAALLLTSLFTQAQVATLTGGATKDYSNDPVVVIIPVGDTLTLVTASQAVQTISVDDIQSLSWLPLADAIRTLPASDVARPFYDRERQTLIVNGGNADADLCVYDAQGRRVLMARTRSLSVEKLPEGLYIVTCNKENNAKFLKK